QAGQGQEQVGPERLGGTGAAAQRAQDPLEGAVDQVLGVTYPAVGGRQALGCLVVTDVQLGERGLVAIACLVEQLTIGKSSDRHDVGNLAASLSQQKA